MEAAAHGERRFDLGMLYDEVSFCILIFDALCWNLVCWDVVSPACWYVARKSAQSANRNPRSCRAASSWNTTCSLSFARMCSGYRTYLVLILHFPGFHIWRFGICHFESFRRCKDKYDAKVAAESSKGKGFGKGKGKGGKDKVGASALGL